MTSGSFVGSAGCWGAVGSAGCGDCGDSFTSLAKFSVPSASLLALASSPSTTTFPRCSRPRAAFRSVSSVVRLFSSRIWTFCASKTRTPSTLIPPVHPTDQLATSDPAVQVLVHLSEHERPHRARCWRSSGRAAPAARSPAEQPEDDLSASARRRFLRLAEVRAGGRLVGERGIVGRGGGGGFGHRGTVRFIHETQMAGHEARQLLRLSLAPPAAATERPPSVGCSALPTSVIPSRARIDEPAVPGHCCGRRTAAAAAAFPPWPRRGATPGAGAGSPTKPVGELPPFWNENSRRATSSEFDCAHVQRDVLPVGRDGRLNVVEHAGIQDADLGVEERRPVIEERGNLRVAARVKQSDVTQTAAIRSRRVMGVHLRPSPAAARSRRRPVLRAGPLPPIVYAGRPGDTTTECKTSRGCRPGIDRDNSTTILPEREPMSAATLLAAKPTAKTARRP